ncbi:MAG: type IV pilus modification PilV family protein [Thalassotalea sp.]
MLNKLSASKPKKTASGFTLIEIIIGIVVFSLSLSIIVQLLAPAEENSADQIHQIKASELGQALMNDIMSRAFDDNSDMAGGLLRCDEDQDLSLTVEVDEKCTDVMGPELGEDSRSDYDDVDDFNGFSTLITATDGNFHEGYNQFQINVVVEYAGTKVRLAKRLAKSIYIVVTTPLGTQIEFTVFKANF